MNEARKLVHVERIEGEIYADGAATVVFIDMQQQKPVRIPEAIRGLLAEAIQ